MNKETQLREALEAVLLFHCAAHWDGARRTQWWNYTQTQEATTLNLCDTVRIALGKLPSVFGDFAGRYPSEIPSDMPLSHEQRNALERLGLPRYPSHLKDGLPVNQPNGTRTPVVREETK